MSRPSSRQALPPPIVVAAAGGNSAQLLDKEWLLANKLGAYASATAAGVNTRRYHGLLVAATVPPAGRIVALSCLLDQFIRPQRPDGETTFDLATFEFKGVFSPDGRANLVEFRNDLAATFCYRCGDSELTKEIILAEAANAVAVRYRLLNGPAGRLRLRPFVTLRDYHDLLQGPPQRGMALRQSPGSICVRPDPPSNEDEGPCLTDHALHMSVAPASRASFHPLPQWWYRFRYRADLARGQDGFEDLYTPGAFEVDLRHKAPVQLTASLDELAKVSFSATVAQKRRRLMRLVEAVGPGADQTTRRLAMASDAFVVTHKQPRLKPATTIVAGYHWFVDWGRDAMIASAGLLLETGRFKEAQSVLRLFARAAEDGMVPNCFSERGDPPGFNSIDASLWFVVAADRYVAASGDHAAWKKYFSPTVERICQAYHDGTRFDIHTDVDGLLTSGDELTQLTWMDAELDGPAGRRPVTPRHGKAVEANALWHAALTIAARRCPGGDHYRRLAEAVAEAFERTFWNDQAGCLYDCVRGDWADPSIRPNQITAVAMPQCPLRSDRQRSILDVVRRELLTPMGLRTLAPADGRYRGLYGGSWVSRDQAYHQGTVWPWLLGPFIEAHLRVNDFSPQARGQARQWLSGFDAHLAEAGLGYISEVFNGDPPHAPAGCIAQAWSVAEILRAKRLIVRPSPAAS